MLKKMVKMIDVRNTRIPESIFNVTNKVENNETTKKF